MIADPGKEKKNSEKIPEKKADSAENVAGKHVTRGSVRDNSTDVKQGNSRKGQTDASLNLEELLELIAADQDYPLDQLKRRIGSHGVQYEILKAFRKREAVLRAKLEKEAEKSRKEVEDRLEKLRHSEERYRTLQANIPVGIFRSTPTGKILSANLALVRMLGYDSEEELRAISVRDLYLLAERRREFIKILESAGSVADFEAQMRQKDGSGLWVSLSATAVKDDKGKVHFDGIIEDIIERKRAEEELREREELYRTLVDTAQEGITIVDLDENMVFVNPRMAEFFGYKPDKLIGRSFLDFVPAEEAELIRSQTGQRKKGESSRYELTLVHKNGTHQRALIAAAPLYDAEGKPYAAIGVFTDITERKQAEEELKRSGDKLRENEELYRTLVNTAQEAIILDDPDENIVFINPTAARLLGYPPDELIGRSLFDFIPPEEVKALRSQTAYRITKQESSRYELTLLHRNGSSRRMLVTGAPVYDAEGKIKATMGVFTDITELSVLAEIGRAISSTLDINEIYGVIHEQVKRLINADNFYIAHYDKKADEVTFPYVFEEGRLKPWTSRRGGKGMTEHVIRTGKPHLFHGDSKKEAAKIGVEPIGKPSHSWLGVPMIIRNEVIGVMAVQSFDPTLTYSEKDMGFMRTVANQAAQAVENARSYSNLEQRLTELSVFNEIGRALSSTLKMDELMEVLLNQTRRLMYADDFFIASFDEDTNMIEFPLYLEKGEVTELPSRPFGNGLTEHVISSREALLIQGENFEETRKRLGLEMILHGEPALSWLGVPMISHDKVLGIMSVQSTEESHIFDENHIRLLASIANQAAGAFANARAYSRLERRLTELSIFNEVGYALGSTLDLGELLEVIYTQTSRVMDTESFYIALYDENAGTIEFPLYMKDGKPVEMSARPFGKGLTEHVIKNRKSFLVREDVANATLNLGIGRVVTGEEAKCWLGVPMIFQDRVIGVMTVQSTRKAGLYDVDHERLLSSMANQAAQAVENARGYSELEERLTELSVFNEIGTALGSVLEFDELLNVIYEQTRRVMDADQFYISLYDEKTNTVEFPLTIEEGKRVEIASRKFGNSSSEYVITTRKPLLIKRDFAKTLQGMGLDVVLGEGEAEPLCWLGVPMISQNKVMGVMAVQNVDKEEVFDEDDLHILTTIANQAAGAIANARAYRQVEDQLTARSVINEISRAISSTLDVNKIYGVIHKQIKRLLNADNFYIALYNKELDEVSFPYAFQDGEIQGWGSRSAGKGMTEYVLNTGKAQLFRGGSKEEATRRGVEHIGKPSHSWLGVPMIMRNEVIGVMAVQSFDAQIRYSERDMGLMQMVAGQAAGAVVNARAYAMLERSGEELKALLETSSAVSATLEEEKVAHLIAVKATELIGADGCTVYRFDSGIEELVPITTTVVEGREEVLGHHISVGEGITGQAAAEKRAILANNVHHDPKAARIPGTKELPTCLLSAPLMARGDLLGVMTLARFSEEEFVDHDLELFILFARQVAEAAANSRLFGRLRELNKDLERRGEELGTLFNTSTELSSTLDEEEVGELIAQKATELIGADGCTVYRFDPETEKLIPQITTSKKNTEAVMGYHPSLGEGTTGRAVKERRPILANHVHLESKSAHVPGTKREPTCLLSAPLISKGELLGGMTISRLSDREFTEHDLQVFTLFARQAAEAFANSRLFGRLRNLNKDLQTRREELQALFKTSTELSSILEEEETGKLIAQRAKELITSSGCTFYKFDKESAKLIPIATTVMEEYEQRMAYQVPLGEGITGRSAKERNPILANNIHLDPKAPRVPGTEDLPTCLLSAPLVARGELLGTMTLVRMSEDEFTDHDLQLFTLFVRQAAEAFANTRLFTQLRELNESLEQKVAERTTELERAKIKLEEVHSDYKERVRSRLATLAPVMEKVSLGDFNENISLHEEEDEFTELFVGLNLMIDDLRFMFEENRRRGEELKELNEDLQRRSGELRELLEASTSVAATLEEEAVAKLIGDRATNFIRAARCTVYRFDPEAGELIPQMTTSKEDRDKILDYKIKLGEGVTGGAAAERKSIIANNVHLDPKAPRIPGTQERPTCLLSVPLLSKGELLGVMTLTRLSEEEFIEHDRELFTLFARQVADATANSRLLSRLQDLNENLEAIVAQRTSELKESNRKTAAFARELEEVIYVTSHDLKTPLRAISGFSQFLYEDYRDKLDMEGKLYLTRLIDAVKRMEKLLDDVLEISAVTRTGQVFKDVPAGDLIKEAIKMVDVGDDADIIYNPDELPTVLCDSAKMVEVFYNLISNGLKFNDKPRKQVKITAQTSGGSHEFIFSDNGIGIEKRHYERIFQIFQRLHQREDYSGTGVGLSMVKRVVEEHNGRIWVESQVGVGTIFHFTLPLHQEEDNEAANPERSM